MDPDKREASPLITQMQRPLASQPPIPRIDAQSDHHTGREAPLWMRRIGLIMLVLLLLEIGILLIVLPWTSAWTENTIFASYPAVQMAINGGFIRGVVSGIGLLNLWMGIWEAVHYRDHRRT